VGVVPLLGGLTAETSSLILLLSLFLVPFRWRLGRCFSGFVGVVFLLVVVPLSPSRVFEVFFSFDCICLLCQYMPGILLSIAFQKKYSTTSFCLLMDVY
jgi:hypothetical protein